MSSWQDFCQYWPVNQKSIHCEPYVVGVQSFSKLGGQTTLYELSVEKKVSGNLRLMFSQVFFNNYKIAPTKIWFVSKRFYSWQYLCVQGWQDNRSVTLVRFEDWFEEIPGNISEMMSLISFVDSRREVDDNSSPVIIQCMWVPTLCWWCYRSVQCQLFLWMTTQSTPVYTTTCPPSWLVRWRECQMAKRL